MPLRLIFMGTPGFAVPTLKRIVEAGHDVAAVYTRAPRPANRGMDLKESPIAREAHGLGLRVFTPANFRSVEAVDAFRAHEAHAAVVVAYGLILPSLILGAVKLGCFNLHASLLPRWRGAAPINRVIMAGGGRSGVMVMKMDEELDTGPIVMREAVPIGPDMTAGELHDVLAPLGADLMARAITKLERDELRSRPQGKTRISYAHKIDNTETRINWKWSWRTVHNRCRGLSPFPGAWFEIPGVSSVLRVKVLRTTRGEGAGAPGTVLDDRLTIACREGAVRIVELHPAGRKPMKAEEFLRGTKLAAGARVH